MIPSDLTIEQWDSINAFMKRGATIAEIARSYGIKEDSLRGAIRKRVGDNTNILDVYTALDIPSIEEYIPPTEEDILRDALVDLRVKSDRRIEVLKAEANHLKRLYNAAVRKGATEETLVEVLRDTVISLPTMSMEPLTIPRGKSHGLHTMVGLLSDWHAGEVVDNDVMNGLGGYDMDIFRQRVGLWVRKFIYLLDIERSELEIPRLTLLLDGDMVSGLIHDELIRTNQVSIVDQMKEAAYALAWAIAQVSRHFEEVHVSCTVGNHGRNQKKVEFKEPYVNWDYLAYQTMAFLLKDYDHIQFDIPKSLWQITKIENMNFLHFHGHGIKSWLGIPYYGIDRAIKDLRETLQVGDMYFDGIAMAHFHVPFELMMPAGPLLVNGCAKGGDEFALFALRKWIPPIQTMFTVHEKHGYVGRRLIYLDGNTPEDTEGMGVLPDLWAEGRV